MHYLINCCSALNDETTLLTVIIDISRRIKSRLDFLASRRDFLVFPSRHDGFSYLTETAIQNALFVIVKLYFDDC